MMGIETPTTGADTEPEIEGDDVSSERWEKRNTVEGYQEEIYDLIQQQNNPRLSERGRAGTVNNIREWKVSLGIGIDIDMHEAVISSEGVHSTEVIERHKKALDNRKQAAKIQHGIGASKIALSASESQGRKDYIKLNKDELEKLEEEMSEIDTEYIKLV